MSDEHDYSAERLEAEIIVLEDERDRRVDARQLVARQLVAAILARPVLLDEVPDLEIDHLGDVKLGYVWRAVRTLQSRGRPITIDEIDRQQRASDVVTGGLLHVHAGAEYLTALLEADSTPDSARDAAHVRGWAALLRREHERDAQRVADEEARARIEHEIDEIALRDAEPKPVAAEAGARPRISILVEDVARLDTPPIRSYSTGNAELDARLGGGVSTRQLTSVLGPPGAGKSAWAVDTAIHIAPTLPGLYASTELETHELMARIAGNLIDRPWSAIVRGQVPKAWITEAVAGIRIRLLGSDLLPRDGAKALELIEREAVELAKEHGVPPFIVVDYLQDLARGAERDLRARVGDIATELRVMSQRLDCPVIGISSVARSYYSPRKAIEMRAADDPRVYLAAAKESGDVDYASAAVLFLDVEESDAPVRAARIAVAKSRHDQPGFAGARFAGASGRWSAAPEAVSELSAPGRTVAAAESKLDDADQAVFRTIERLHRKGDAALCTKTQLRTMSGVGVERVAAALERLVHVGKVRTTEIERIEGGKKKRRSIYEPVGVTAEPAEPVLPLDLDGTAGPNACGR